METIRIKVSPEILMAGARETEKAIAAVRNHFSAIEEAVNRSTVYWKGDAAEAHRASFGDLKEGMDEIIKRLTENTNDLKIMAQTYMGTENQVEELSNDLPTDVII